MRMLIAYDGTFRGAEALRLGIGLARQKSSEVEVIYVFNAPLFLGYDSAPGAIELARRDFMLRAGGVEEILQQLGEGLRTRLVLGEGDPEAEFLDYTDGRSFEMLLCPARYRHAIARFKGICEDQGRGISEDALPGKAAGLSVVSTC